jgi:hypothetical protein
MNVNANHNGLRSRTQMSISNNSNVTITAGNKGIRAAGNNHGHVSISSSNVKITTNRSDGIDAGANITVLSTTLEITVAGGRTAGRLRNDANDGFISQKGLRTSHHQSSGNRGNINITAGTITINSAEDGISSAGDLNIGNATLSVQAGRRAIRGRDNLNANNSNITVPNAATAFHSNRTHGRVNIRSCIVTVTRCNIGITGAYLNGTGGRIDIRAVTQGLDFGISQVFDPQIAFTHLTS